MSAPPDSRGLATPEAIITVQIPFHDIDLMGVAWHGHYFKYLEMARAALLDSIRYNYREMKESGLSWPVVDVRLRYLRPARLGQLVAVHGRLTEFELRLKIDYRITDAASGERLTEGYSIQVPVDITTGELVLGNAGDRLPEAWHHAMRTAVAAILPISTFTDAAAESVGPGEVVAQIESQLARSPVLRASFEQERTMQVLTRPISTRGRVTAVTGRGVLWQVREPYRATVLMTADAIVEWDDQDTPRQIEMAAAPAFRALAGPRSGR